LYDAVEEQLFESKQPTRGLCMSGSHFSYAFRRTREFSEDLEKEIENNDVGTDNCDPQGHDPQTLARLSQTVKITGIVAQLMRHTELLYQGDHSPETFSALHDEAIAELKAIMGQP
jgi:hypothetical protein